MTSPGVAVHTDAAGRSWARALAPDAVVVAIVLVVVYLTEAHLFKSHNWISYGGGDWAAHAYRAQYLKVWGLTTWDPQWDAGLPIFQGYQTAPHAVVVATTALTGTSVPHAMMLWTWLLILLYTAGGYAALRLCGVGVAGAVLGAALLYDNADLGPPIGDYSYLFGLALVPLLVWVALRLIGGRWGWLGAVAVGLSPYFHPYSSVAVVAVLAVRFAMMRLRIGWTAVGQMGVALLVAAFYWLPFVHSARPKFEDPWNWSVAFERSLFAQWAVGGLSVGLLVAVAAGIGALAFRSARALPTVRSVSAPAIGGAAVLGLFVVLAYNGHLPNVVIEIEPARWMPLVGTLAAMAVAPLGDLANTAARRFVARLRQRGVAAATVAAVALTSAGLTVVAVLGAEGHHWFDRAGIPIGDSVPYGFDLKDWADSHAGLPTPLMVWTNTNDIAFSSYQAPDRFHYTGDYIVTRQWTVAAPVLQELMQDDVPGMPAVTGDFSPIERYLRMYGVQYLFLSRDVSANISFIDGPLKGHLDIVDQTPNGWIATVPWHSVQAFTAPAAAVRETTLPDLGFLTYAESALRDQLVQRYDDVAYSASSIPASWSWTSPTTVTLTASARPGDLLVVPQNWDTVWSATTGDGASLHVERAGPNFTAIDLGGRTGPVTITLHHGMYATWIVAAALGLAGLTVALVMTLVGRRD